MFKAAPVSADALLYGIKMLQASVSTVTKAMNLLLIIMSYIQIDRDLISLSIFF
jgi:hypothetical protein